MAVVKVPGLALFIHFININPLPCLPPSPLLLPAHRGHIHPPKRAPWGDWKGRRGVGTRHTSTSRNFSATFEHHCGADRASKSPICADQIKLDSVLTRGTQSLWSRSPGRIAAFLCTNSGRIFLRLSSRSAAEVMNSGEASRHGRPRRRTVTIFFYPTFCSSSPPSPMMEHAKAERQLKHPKQSYEYDNQGMANPVCCVRFEVYSREHIMTWQGCFSDRLQPAIIPSFPSAAADEKFNHCVITVICKQKSCSIVRKRKCLTISNLSI